MPNGFEILIWMIERVAINARVDTLELSLIQSQDVSYLELRKNDLIHVIDEMPNGFEILILMIKRGAINARVDTLELSLIQSQDVSYLELQKDDLIRCRMALRF